MKKNLYATALIILFLSSYAFNTTAGDPQVSIDAYVNPAFPVRNGETIILNVSVKIPRTYHLYSMTKIPDGPMALHIAVSEAAVTPEGNWFGPSPSVERDPNFNLLVEYYEKEAAFQKVFRVIATNAETLSISIRVKGQICDEYHCIPFAKRTFPEFKMEKGPARDKYKSIPNLNGSNFPPDRKPPDKISKSGDNGGDSEDSPMSKGLLGFLIIAFLAGLGALATPCVFPMIPITVSFFSKFAKVSIRRSLTMAGIYAVSIILAFTAIGVFISMIFGAVGMQVLSASVGFNVFLAALLVFFAFNLFGLFEIQMPGWLITKTRSKEQALLGEENSLFKQSVGVFFMAITFTLVSFTCTVGFVGVVLAEAAKGNVFYPVMGMLAFSIAFSLPFFFLAVFPSWADKLRGKSGDWMVAIKVTLGFLELAGAFKFLSNVDLVLKWEFVTRPFVLSFWAGIFILCALYLLRIFNLSGSNADQRSVGPVRMAFALLMLSLGVYSFTGIRDTKSMGGWLDGWLPPAHYPGSESDLSEYGTDRLPWIVDNIEEGMKRAKRENKPLFIDFTGYTCTNCRYMEGSVFPKPKVRALLEKMILVTAYTDGNSEICAEQRKYQINRFDTAALPFYAILNPHNDTVLARHPDMTKNVAKFIEFLSGGIKEFDSVKPLDIPLKDSLVARQQPTVDGGTSDAGMSDSKDLLVLANSGKTVDFKFPGLFTNDKTKLSSLRGNWVLLNFWASWCAPCKKELKNDFPVALKEFKDVKFVTVAFDGEETAGSARKFLKTVDLNNHTHLMGGEDITEAGLSKDFNVSESLPFTYLLHPGGYIAWMKKGSVDLKLLKSLLKKTIK